MDKILQQLKRQLASLSISEEERQQVLEKMRPLLEEQQRRADFMHARMLKDKNIAINLLNQAIADLQVQQEEIQEVNRTLIQQKYLLEEQSQQLRKSLERLEMSYAELEQFSYIASHDLRNPLRTIASYAQLLQKRYDKKLDLDAEEFLSFIISGAKQMNDIIGDLLEYSFIQEKKIRFSAIDFNQVLDIVRFNLYVDLQDTNAEIEAEPLPIDAHASKAGMLQLLQNLIGNAIKFRAERQPHIQIRCKTENTHWHFEIQDNGMGLDEAYAERVFLPFHRLSDRTVPGSGIGLAICKKIVKLHNGDIWYKSEAGIGTTFYFTISRALESHE